MERCQEPLIDMIDNLGYINRMQFDTAKGTVRTLQNHNDGSGTSVTRKEWFDDHGRLAWSMDGLGRVTSRQYNPLTGRLAQTSEGIDDDALQPTPPAAWNLPASGGANLATDYQFDAFGPVTRTLGPVHTALVAGTPTSIRAAWCACSWYCKQKPDPLTLAGICFSACESAYLLACETDHDTGKTCCQQALAVWAATGEWPGLFWQLLHGCPITAGN